MRNIVLMCRHENWPSGTDTFVEQLSGVLSWLVHESMAQGDTGFS